MTCPWREQPAPLLEQHCNPRVAVPHFQEALERYAARSAAARQRLPGFYDLRYGSRPQQTSLHFSQVVAGCSGWTRARVAPEQARLGACEEREDGAERYPGAARFSARHSVKNGAHRMDKATVVVGEQTARRARWVTYCNTSTRP